MQALVARGVRPPSVVNGTALVDTGASITCVNEASARRAGLAVVDQGLMTSASHSYHQVPIFAGEIEIPNFGTIQINGAMGAQLDDQGLVALIGRDILQKVILVYSGVDGSFSLSL